MLLLKVNDQLSLLTPPQFHQELQDLFDQIIILSILMNSEVDISSYQIGIDLSTSYRIENNPPVGTKSYITYASIVNDKYQINLSIYEDSLMGIDFLYNRKDQLGRFNGRQRVFSSNLHTGATGRYRLLIKALKRLLRNI